MLFRSEAGELAAAIARNNIEGIKDAIGDMCVVEVILSEMDEHALQPLAYADWNDDYHWDESRLIRVMLDLVVAQDIATIANRYNLTLEECWQAAWDAIKDRKGYMNEQGVFVKEET